MCRRRCAAAPYPRLRVWLRDPTEEGVELQPGPPIETVHWAVEELEYTRLAWEDLAGACAVAPISRLGKAFALIAFLPPLATRAAVPSWQVSPPTPTETGAPGRPIRNANKA